MACRWPKRLDSVETLFGGALLLSVLSFVAHGIVVVLQLFNVGIFFGHSGAVRSPIDSC